MISTRGFLGNSLDNTFVGNTDISLLEEQKQCAENAL